MQPDVLTTLQAWAVSALLYPGLLFGVLLALAGEWLSAGLRNLLTPRTYRTAARPYAILQPLYNYLKLAGREPDPSLLPVRDPAHASGSAGSLYRSGLAAVGAAAPVLALMLLPFPVDSALRRAGVPGDLILVTVLLTVYPLCRAASRLGEGGAEALRGAQDLGGLVTGLVPVLLSMSALVEVSASHSLKIGALTAAPETAAQTTVRVLAGVALFVALPWWSRGRGRDLPAGSAGAYAGMLLQRAALAGVWAALVLPAPGELPWALVVYIGGSLLAYAGMSILSERWAPAARERDAARLAWVAAMPAALFALVSALWWGAL